MKLKSLLLIFFLVLTVSTAIGQTNAFDFYEKDTTLYFDFDRANLNPNNVVKFKLKEISKIENLKKFPNLRYLDLIKLELKELPLEIQNLTQLKGLNLEINNLTTLPIELKKLKNLEVLILSHNDFEILPYVLTELPKLKYLKVPKKILIPMLEVMKESELDLSKYEKIV